MREPGGRAAGVAAVQSGGQEHPFAGWMGYLPLTAPDGGLYSAMREAVPLIDAAIDKTVRLAGGFALRCAERRLQPAMDRFVRHVRVGPCGRGLHQFVAGYLDSLLTYGNAVGEMVLEPGGGGIAALYNARLQDVQVRRGRTPLEVEICAVQPGGGFAPVRYPELVLFTPLNPPAGEVRGVSLLRSLPFVTSILLKIYHSTGVNFERVANLRYAVVYRPGPGGERANAREIAEGIAREWGDAMASSKNGAVKDFVAVGDVRIQVIGADNQMLETEVPVRQMLEQIVAKLGIPPFMLGLHWSSTERMSSTQADILTSELWSYRRMLEGVIERIAVTWLRLRGCGAGVEIVWDDINLQDEVETAAARLQNAQAEALERQLARGAG